MSAFKYTWVFRYTSGASTISPGNRSGGWTESHYQTTFTPQRLQAFKDLAVERALLLPQGAVIIGIRIQQVDPSAAQQGFNVNYPGPPQYARDIPQMALKFRLRGTGVTNVRSYAAAAIPDAMVVNGEFNPDPVYKILLQNYLNTLNNWCFRATSLTALASDIATIDATGLIATNQDVLTAVGSALKLKNIKTSTGSLVSGKFKVTVYNNSRSFQVKGWTAGAGTGGTVTPVTYIYPQITGAADSVPKIGTRKIGRPSDPYRGRRSKRRK